MKIYSVRDINMGFNQPFADVNDDVAKRGFAYAVNSTDMMGFRPGDFDLYCLGEFDTNTGDIDCCIPTLICHATEVYTGDRN